MKQGYPRFMLCEDSKEDIEIQSYQRPILEELEKRGYGIEVERDFYMPIPCQIRDYNYPLRICHFVSDKPIINVFNNWKEIEEFVSSLSLKE